MKTPTYDTCICVNILFLFIYVSPVLICTWSVPLICILRRWSNHTRRFIQISITNVQSPSGFEKCSVFVSCQRRVGSGQPLGVCSASPTSRPPAASSNPSVGRPRLKAPPSLLATPTPWVSLTPAAWWGSRQQPAGHWGWLDFSEKCLRFFRACSETLRLPSRGVCLAWRRPAQPQDLVRALDCSDNPAQDLELLERR